MSRFPGARLHVDELPDVAIEILETVAIHEASMTKMFSATIMR
jgi:hypothetical protein